MDVLTLSRIIFLNRLIEAYERQRRYDDPAYMEALKELARLQRQQEVEEKRPAGNTGRAY